MNVEVNFFISDMEVPLVLLSAAILTSFLPVIWSLNDFDGDSLLGDITNDESSASRMDSFQWSPTETDTSPDYRQFMDPSIEKTPANANLNYQYNFMRSVESKLNWLIESNGNIIRAIHTLDLKTNRILIMTDAKNEPSSSKNNFDLMDCLEMTNKLNNIEQHIASLDNNYRSVQSDVLKPHEIPVIKNFRRQDMEVVENSRQAVQYLKRMSSVIESICTMNCQPPPSHRQRMCRSCNTTIKNEVDKWKNLGLNSENTYRNVRRDKTRVTFEPNKFNCHDLQMRINGTYKFASLDEVSNEGGRFFYERYCDFNTDGGAWTVIQNRFLNDQTENFNRSWLDYKLGFGDLNKEFWFGNDFIHKLTSDEDMKLRIVLEDTSGRTEWAQYSLFKVDAEEYNYNLIIGGYKGTFPDEFIYNNDQEFSTFDRQNDNNDNLSCASSYGNGWWFNNCTDMSHRDYKGGIWKNWVGSNALKSSKMMVRPRGLWDNENSSENQGYIYTSTGIDP